MPACGEGRGDVGPKSQRRLVSARETPAEVRGEEPRKEKSEKLRDWSELQGETGKNAHKCTRGWNLRGSFPIFNSRMGFPAGAEFLRATNQ